MIEISKVFIDTAPFIYFLEKKTDFSYAALHMFLHYANTGAKLMTSVFTDLEYKVQPKRNLEYKKIDTYNLFKNEFKIDTVSINDKICDITLDIRANNKSIKFVDAFQLAIAIYHNCDIFVTNDKDLTKFKGIKCVTLDNY